VEWRGGQARSRANCSHHFGRLAVLIVEADRRAAHEAEVLIDHNALRSAWRGAHLVSAGGNQPRRRTHGVSRRAPAEASYAR
jgi:hypothetical protein